MPDLGRGHEGEDIAPPAICPQVKSHAWGVHVSWKRAKPRHMVWSDPLPCNGSSETRDMLVTISFVGADKADSSSGNGKNALRRNDRACLFWAKCLVGQKEIRTLHRNDDIGDPKSCFRSVSDEVIRE